ncbi:MAG: hypothetical protein Q9197_005078 [Variospora fuerteventurae]
MHGGAGYERVELIGRNSVPSALEGTRTTEEKDPHMKKIRAALSKGEELQGWETEPPLEASQIAEIEDKIGGGLIEEVIQVAEGEHSLVDTILESKSWEDLEEKPPQGEEPGLEPSYSAYCLPGQWDYFARDQHTPGTQEPPKAKN